MNNIYTNTYYKYIKGKFYAFRIIRKFNQKDFVVEAVTYDDTVNKKENKEYFCLLDPTLYFVKRNWVRHPERKEGAIIAKFFIETTINQCNSLNVK